MTARLRTHVAALMLLAPIAANFAAQPAHAASRTAVQPAIAGISLNADAGLAPGSTLRVQLNASANARRASVTLGGNGPTVNLRPIGRGSYAGTYVVRRSDRIDPMQPMTAHVTVGQLTTARDFRFPPSFQAIAMGGPGAPVPAVAPPANSIERFAMRADGPLQPGREVHFWLRGAPGGDAWLDIPGVIRGVDLAETRPGVYEGSYTIRRRDNLDALRNAVATLRLGDRRMTARVDMDRGYDRGGFARDDRGGYARDNRLPQISELMPANGDRVAGRGQVQIGARLADPGSGIDPASVRLRINGRDVTGDARVSPDEIRYRADLPPGRYTAEVSVRDNAGNADTKAWAFDVVPGDRYGALPPGGLPLEVLSPTNNAVVDANGNLVVQGRTAPFASVRVQVESSANVAGVLGVTQPVADVTAQADRDGRFDVAVTPRGLPIPGAQYQVHLTASSGNRVAEERVTVFQRRG